jgi:hypothetical protein
VPRFSPLNDASSRLAPLLALALALGCGARATTRPPAAEKAAACEVVDSLLSRHGLPRPAAMTGRATFDVEQYRVRGRFELRLDAAGGAVLEFSGTTLLGGHREDVVVSTSGDTLRILDRERGRFYEGAEAEELIRGETRVGGDWLRALQRALGEPRSCPLASVEYRADGVSGQAADGPFQLRWEAGRLVEARWPDPARSETFSDRLDVRYQWDSGGLSRLEARLPVRGWRVRLEADSRP